MRSLISYGPDATSTSKLHVVGIDATSVVRSRDTFLNLLNYSPRFVSTIETGEIQLSPEDQKSVGHEVWLRTYTEGGTVAPDVIMQTKAVQDSDWRTPGQDPHSTIQVTNTACTQTGGAFSNIVGTGDGSTVAYTTPVLATQLQIVTVDDTATTAYTVTGTKQITMTAAPATGKSVKVYWTNEPSIYIAANDYIYTSYGYHRVIALTDFLTASLEWYPGQTIATHTDGTHMPAKQIPTGEGETVFGLTKVVDSLQIRFIIIPRDSASSPTIIEPLGFTIVYSTAGSRQNRQGV